MDSVKYFLFLLFVTLIRNVSVTEIQENIFTKLQFNCEYTTDELTNSTTCIINDFHPGTSLYRITNPEIATRIAFTNSSHIRVPKTIFLEVPYLTHLNLSSCQVRRIQKSSFDNAVSLVSLDLSHNHIEEIIKSTFKRASNLQELFLNDNQIEVIEYNAFKKLRYLTTLTLNNNHVKHLSGHAFDQLASLRTLLLNDNRISVISSTLKGLRSLETLTLHNNDLNYVRVKVMNKYLRNLRNVTLQNNEWICPGLKIMTDYMEANMIDTDVVAGNEMEMCTNSDEVTLLMDEKDLAEIQELSVSTFVNPVFNHHFNKKRASVF